MSTPFAHIASALSFLASRPARETEDHAALDAMAWSRATTPLPLPKGLSLEWLGTSGFRLAYEGYAILIDPYLRRRSLRELVFWDSRVSSLRDLSTRVRRADAILVGHTHFDHVADVPTLARAFDCAVYGSSSLVQLMKIHGDARLAVEVVPHRTFDVGPFAITFVPSRHSRLVLGLWTPADGELSCEHFDELSPRRYRCGQVWGIHVAVGGATFYHQGSCDLLDDEIRHRGIDFMLAGISGRRFTRRYVERILSRLEPKVIIPHHFDDFFRPLGAPLEFSFNVNLPRFLDEVSAVSKDFAVRTVKPLQTIAGG